MCSRCSRPCGPWCSSQPCNHQGGSLMSHESRRLAGILLVIFPTVIYGGVILILSLVVLRYVDEATLSDRLRGFVRHATPAAAILLPLAYFLSVLSPTATEPNALIYLAFVGAVVLAAGLITLGVGLLRKPGMIQAVGRRPLGRSNT